MLRLGQRDSHSSRVPCTSDVQSSPCRHCVEHAHKPHTSCTTCVMVHIIQRLPRTVSPTARGCLVPNTESERRKAPSSSWKLASLRGRVIINFHVSLFTNGILVSVKDKMPLPIWKNQMQPPFFVCTLHVGVGSP